MSLLFLVEFIWLISVAVFMSVGDFCFTRDDAKKGQGLNDSIFPLLLHVMKINIYWCHMQLGPTFHKGVRLIQSHSLHVCVCSVFNIHFSMCIV